MDETREPDAARPERRRRFALERIIVLSLPFVAALLYGLWSFNSTDRQYRDLDRFGVETRATILSKRIVRMGTDRPRYAHEMTVGFTVGDTMRRGAVRVTSGFYDSHEPPQRVPIRYLPDNPEVRAIDPAMRGKSMRSTLTIVGILLFIGVANIFLARDGSRRRARQPAKEQEQ